MVKYRFLLKVRDRLIDYRIRLFVDFIHQFFQLHGRCDIIDELYEVDDTCEGIDEGDRRGNDQLFIFRTAHKEQGRETVNESPQKNAQRLHRGLVQKKIFDCTRAEVGGVEGNDGQHRSKRKGGHREKRPRQ